MQNRLKNIEVFLLLLLAGLLLFFGLKVWGHLDQLSAFHPDEPNKAMHFGGNDWVEWEDSPEGVVAAQVHPIVEFNPILKGNYIQEGDLLLAFDQKAVYKAEVVNQITAASPPGTPFLYQVQRKDPFAFSTVGEGIILENSYAPAFSFYKNPTLWGFFPYLLVLGVLLSLIILLIVYPLMKPNMSTNRPVFAVIVVAFMVFGLLFLRQFNLLVRNEYVNLSFEKGFTLIFFAVLLNYGFTANLIHLRRKMALWLLPSMLTGLGLLIFTGLCLFNGPFGVYREVLISAALFYFNLHVFVFLMTSVLRKWGTRSRIDRVFHLLALAYTLVLIVWYAVVLGNPTHASPETALFLSYGTLFIPLISSAASQLKFGKVSVVLTRSLQYIVFAALALVLYFLINRLLSQFGVNFRYQNFLELAILIVVMILIRSVYQLYEDRLTQYFVLAQRKKQLEIEAFISTIPQHTSSRELIRDLKDQASRYFGTSFVEIWIKNEPAAALPDNIDEEGAEHIYLALRDAGLYWSANKTVASARISPDAESLLNQTPADLANSLMVNEEMYGFLLLGPKNRGVYNLEDLEIISRMLQQTRLTLGVLHLLEREKLLMQKNYEANLTALRSQINPHFLFNTLNTISALIHDSPDEAEEAVEKLAYIFRYTLKYSSETFVSLSEELSLVRTYLDIEKIRFGDRLQLEYEIDPTLKDVKLPAMVIQTVVENCIKHGIARIIGKGIVSIEAFKEDDFVQVQVYDNGPGIDTGKIYTSTGLSNTITRFEQIYQMKNLLYFENTGDGTLVTIKIPLNHE